MAKTLKNRKPKRGKKQRKSSRNIGKTGGMFGYKRDFHKLVADSKLTQDQQEEAFRLKRISKLPTHSGKVDLIQRLNKMSDAEIINEAKYKQGRASRSSASRRNSSGR